LAVGTAVFPSTRGSADFLLSDRAGRTVTGEVVACIDWAFVTWITSARWLCFRLAAAVTCRPMARIVRVGDGCRAQV
jgi:hypothetical protein